MDMLTYTYIYIYEHSFGNVNLKIFLYRYLAIGALFRHLDFKFRMGGSTGGLIVKETALPP